jgi:hypothetical protein
MSDREAELGRNCKVPHRARAYKRPAAACRGIAASRAEHDTGAKGAPVRGEGTLIAPSRPDMLEQVRQASAIPAEKKVNPEVKKV